MNALNYIAKKYNLDLSQPSPIEITNIGRDQLTVLFKELGFKVGVEIGVLAGDYSELLCKNNPGLKLYGVDPYKAYVQHKDQQQLDRFYEEAKSRLAPYKGYQFIIQPSLEAVKDFEDNSLDFVYIDGAHDFFNVTADLTFWTPKVKPGGIISGHDYIKRKEPTNHRVVEAILPYVKYNKISPWFILGLNAKIPGLIRDRHRSWMWVKQ